MNRESLRFNLALGFLCHLLPPILACTCFPSESQDFVPFARFLSFLPLMTQFKHPLLGIMALHLALHCTRR